MKKTIITLGSAIGLTIMAHGQATTAAVGYNTVTCLPNSDTIVSVPFLNTADSISTTVSGAASGSGSSATITLANVSGLTADQYANQYYVRFTSGQLDGEIFQITASGTDSVTIDTLDASGATTAQIEDGNAVSIYKFWTLGTLFPQATQDTIVESDGNLIFQRKTQILMPDTASEGINLASTRIFFLTASGWVDATDLSDADDEILWPDNYFTIRHPSSVTSGTTYRPSGQVDSHSNATIPLYTRTAGKQDNFIAIPRPVNVKLSDLGLISSGAFVSSSGNLIFNRRDEILVFDNSIQAQNKSAAEVYFHNGSNWIKSSDLSIADDTEITPSQGFIVRKYQTNDGATSLWTNTPAY